MRKNLFALMLIGFLTSHSFVFSQKPSEIKTIKIKKEKAFVKALFDENEYKLVAIDQSGNRHEDAIQSFSVLYKDGNKMNERQTNGNKLSQEIIDILTKKNKSATKICLGEIKAKDKNGHIEDLPCLCDILIFPEDKNPHKK